MKNLFFMLAMLSGFAVLANHGNGDRTQHNHAHQNHKQMADAVLPEAQQARFNRFAEGLTDAKIAIVSVKGMVCDFCARGISKTLRRDKSVKKVDVDLDQGKVFIAYPQDHKIDFANIQKNILSNGQEATDIQILEN